MNEPTNIDLNGCFCRDLPAGRNCTVCDRQAKLDDAECAMQEALAAVRRYNLLAMDLELPHYHITRR